MLENPPPVAVEASTGIRPRRTSGFRPDVEGLRAVAILAVVGYHVGLPLLGGGFVGVDVFFVISGFLITGLLTAEVTRTGRVSLARFWARRARRLLPAATLVLAVVALVSWCVVPVLDHRVVGLDVVASALYVSNIRFAAQATDYLGSDAAPSPVLHFWSLGVEEQFYVVWPLLMLALAWFVLRRRREAGVPVSPLALAGALTALGLASFALSLRLTDRSEPWAFFGMPTRAWEFAVGGLLSIGTAYLLRLPSAVLRVAGVVGAVVLLGSVVLIDPEQPYPGTLALWPVLGTAAVIASGTAPPDRTVLVPAALSWWPMRAIGRLSYSWYLWHWPVLVLVASAVGVLAVPVRLALAVASLVPAALAYRFVESPMRHDPRLVGDAGLALRVGAGLSAAAAATGLVLALVPGGGWWASTSIAPTAADEQTGRGPAPTAPTTTPSPRPSSSGTPTAPVVAWPSGPLVPDPSRARDDLPVTYSDGCHLSPPDVTSPPCVFGDPTSPTTVVLLGDSHAAQWFPALASLARSHRWRLINRTKSGCPAPDVTIYQRNLKRPYDECDTWRRAVIADLVAHPPALVVAAGTRTDSLVDRGTGARMTSGSGAEWQAGWGRTLDRLGAGGVTVAVLRDTPWPGTDVASCVAAHRSRPQACDVARSALDSPIYDVGTTRATATAHGVDLSDLICAPDRCPATQGRYLVYRDTNHLTATFATALAPYLYARLAPLLR